MAVQPILETPSLLLDPALIDEKEMMKEYMAKAVDTIVLQNQKRSEPYFVVFHEHSDSLSRMKISVATKLPSFITNSVVFWVCNRRGICEWLWTVPPKMPGQKHVYPEFNTEGVAYLQAKGAMPS